MNTIPPNLEDRLDTEFASAWRPEPGDKLVGEITGLGERLEPPAHFGQRA